MHEFIAIARERAVVGAALKVAAVVGTLLIAINYGDRIIAGALTQTDLLKMALTYFVPYGVSTWSAVGAIRRQRATTQASPAPSVPKDA